MKPLSFLFLLLVSAVTALAAPRIVSLAGTITNTTGEISASATLVLTIDGEKVTAQLKTEAPLNGTGPLEGRIIGGWCVLEGKLSDDIQLALRGVLSPVDFRGTYLAAVPGLMLQYGKFQLTQVVGRDR